VARVRPCGPHPACCARRPSPTNGCGRRSTPHDRRESMGWPEGHVGRRNTPQAWRIPHGGLSPRLPLGTRHWALPFRPLREGCGPGGARRTRARVSGLEIGDEAGRAGLARRRWQQLYRCLRRTQPGPERSGGTRPRSPSSPSTKAIHVRPDTAWTTGVDVLWVSCGVPPPAVGMGTTWRTRELYTPASTEPGRPQNVAAQRVAGRRRELCTNPRSLLLLRTSISLLW
jgi:hypothetical protein